MSEFDGSECEMLVTGASGLMGANFAVAASRYWRVAGLYSQHPVRIPGARCLPLDLCRSDDVSQTLDRLSPSVVVHFAAATNVDWCENHPQEASRTNVEATAHLARWAASNDCRFVFLSSDSVFDGTRGDYEESDAVNPLNVYAMTKCRAEEAVRAATSNHLILRSNIYGWNAREKFSLAEWVLNSLRSGTTVSGFSDVVFAPLLVNTLAETILHLIRSNESGTFHAASADAVSKYDFAVLLAEIFGVSPALVSKSSIANARFLARRPLNTSLNTRKLQNLGLPGPTVRNDLGLFKQLLDTNYVARLKSMNLPES